MALIGVVSFPCAGREKGNPAKGTNLALERNKRSATALPQNLKPIRLDDSPPQVSNIYSDSANLAHTASPHQSLVPQWLSGLQSSDTLKLQRDSTLTRSAIRDAAKASLIMNSHNDQIKACYHDYLKLNPGVAGKMVVRVFVGPDGSVQQVEVSSSTIAEVDFQQRVIELIKQWKDFGLCASNRVKVYRQEYIFGNSAE